MQKLQSQYVEEVRRERVRAYLAFLNTDRQMQEYVHDTQRGMEWTQDGLRSLRVGWHDAQNAVEFHGDADVRASLAALRSAIRGKQTSEPVWEPDNLAQLSAILRTPDVTAAREALVQAMRAHVALPTSTE